MRPAPTQAVLVGALAAARSARCCSRPSTPSGSRGRRLHRPALSRSRPRHARCAHVPSRSTSELAHRRGLGEVQRALLARATTATSSSSSSPSASPSRTRPSRSRTASAGGSRPTPRRCVARDLAAARRSTDARPSATLCAPRRAARCSSSTATRTRISPLARRGERSPSATGGDAASTLDGGGHGPHARDPVAVNLLIRDVRRARVPPGRAPRAWRAAPRTAASARSTSPRRSASATPGATSRSPASCASSTPTSRSTGSPRTRSPRVLGRRAASAIHPASALLANESAHIESESAEHDLHCLPGDPADGRDPGRQLHGLRRRRARASATTSWIGDEAWELDYYLHENPELKRAPFAWLTDFVGWLPMPDGGEREACLTADYNAEMIEHIAALPASPRPVDLRRQPRRHRRRTAFGPGLPDDPRLDRGATSTSPATSPASTPPSSADRERAAGRARLPPTTSASASSPSAAPASAATCCAG